MLLNQDSFLHRFNYLPLINCWKRFIRGNCWSPLLFQIGISDWCCSHYHCLSQFSKLRSRRLQSRHLELVALAFGARRGELIALRRDLQFICLAENWSYVLLYLDLSFCLKPQGVALPHPVPQGGCHSLVSSQSLKVLPVRHGEPECVNFQETLFLPLNRTNSLTWYHLSELFADALHFRYSHTPDCSSLEIHSNVHQLKSIFSPLANLCRTPLEQLVLAGFWSSPTVVSDFYLRSLSYFTENLYSVAPLIVFNTNVRLPKIYERSTPRVGPTPVVCGHLIRVPAFIGTFSGLLVGLTITRIFRFGFKIFYTGSTPSMEFYMVSSPFAHIVCCFYTQAFEFKRNTPLAIPLTKRRLLLGLI